MLRGSYRNIEAAMASGKVKFVEGDIRDRDLLDRLCDGVDYCFHMAALRITRCAENPCEAFDVMYQGVFNVIESCLAHRVKKLVAASSASIYGQADSFPTNETHHPYNNRTLYGAAKMASELMCRAFHDMQQLNYVAMRYFNVYGPRMDTEGKYTEVLIRWYYLIKEMKQPVVFGDGEQTMDFVYVGDVARANILSMKSNVTNEVFNVATGVETSLKQLCHELISVMGSTVEPRFVPLPAERKAVEVQRRLADISKAAKMIGFRPSVPISAGLEQLVKWLDTRTENVL